MIRIIGICIVITIRMLFYYTSPSSCARLSLPVWFGLSVFVFSLLSVCFWLLLWPSSRLYWPGSTRQSSCTRLYLRIWFIEKLWLLLVWPSLRFCWQGSTSHLAFTRYCFTLKLLVGVNPPFILPSHVHCPHYCNTIARLLRKIRRPPDLSCVCYTHYTILAMAISCKGQPHAQAVRVYISIISMIRFIVIIVVIIVMAPSSHSSCTRLMMIYLLV